MRIARDIRDDDNELVAPESDHGVFLAELLAESRGHLFQEEIPGDMPE